VPVIVDTYIKDGETINVYESGAHYNVTRKHLVKAPEHALITPERSRELREIRAAKAARLLRAQIRHSTSEKLGIKMNSTAEAVAVSGGMLWDEIVLNPEAYPRDRVLAFKELAEVAEMTNNSKRTNEEKNISQPIGEAINQLTAILREIHGSGREIVDAPAHDLPAITDTRNE
jgi:hypothetical protein